MAFPDNCGVVVALAAGLVVGALPLAGVPLAYIAAVVVVALPLPLELPFTFVDMIAVFLCVCV